MTVAIVLAVLADFDQLPLAFGVPDRGIYGHRGLMHTPLFAVTLGLSALAYAKLRRWQRPLRAALTTFLLVASHALLDAMSQEGRGIFLLWPLSAQRFHLVWRPIPDAPTGLAFFSPIGLQHLVIELIYFCPAVAYALRPTLRRWGAWRRDRAPRQLEPSS
jgi:inner membrane protein